MLELGILQMPSFPRRRESKFRKDVPDFCLRRLMPGVARRLLTFLASPRKVSKRRRPQVRRPAKTPGSLRCSRVKAAAELVARIGLITNGLVCARHSDSPRRLPLHSLRCSAPLMGTRVAHHDCHSGEGREPIRFRTWIRDHGNRCIGFRFVRRKAMLCETPAEPCAGMTGFVCGRRVAAKGPHERSRAAQEGQG